MDYDNRLVQPTNESPTGVCLERCSNGVFASKTWGLYIYILYIYPQQWLVVVDNGYRLLYIIRWVNQPFDQHMGDFTSDTPMI
jgi:hypothetical protein